MTLSYVVPHAVVSTQQALVSHGGTCHTEVRTCRSPWPPLGRPGASGVNQLNESPQAQEPVAFGLSIVKPCFSIVSTKSIDAPLRYGALIRSVTTLTPPKSATTSPSS